MGYMKPAGQALGRVSSVPGASTELQPTMKLTAALLVLCVALLNHSSECPPASAPCPCHGAQAMVLPGSQPRLRPVLTLLPSHLWQQAPYAGLSSAPEGQGQSIRVPLLSLRASSHAPAYSSFPFSSTNPRPSQPSENVSAGLGREHSSALWVILQGPAQVSPSLGNLPGPILRAHPQATSYDPLSSQLPARP